MPADLTTRRRRRTGAAVALAVGAMLFTAGSAGAAMLATPADDSPAVSPPPPSQPTRANGNTKHTTRLYGKDAFHEAVAVTQLVYGHTHHREEPPAHGRRLPNVGHLHQANPTGRDP